MVRGGNCALSIRGLDRLSNWRLITDNGVAAAFGLAADDVLASRVGTGRSVPTLRLYTYRSYCALVGRFQNARNELRLDYCQANDISVNRRPTGGGAILMGADQLGVALTLPGRGDETYSRARALMGQFSSGIIHGLNQLGVEAQFHRKNDIEVNGKKLAGLGIYRASTGGLLFHASILVDLDVELMLRVLNTPFEKISDKEISTVAARVSTIRRETGTGISLDAVRREIARGYTAAFQVELTPGNFTEDEQLETDSLMSTQYLSDDWIFQQTDVPDTFGSAKAKTPTGLLDIQVTMAGSILKSVLIGGDFFADEAAIADLEAGLRWHTSNSGEVRETLAVVYQRRRGELDGVPLDGLTGVVQKAIRRARASEAKIRSDPYGCFVSPGGARA